MSLYSQFKTDENAEKNGIVLNYGPNSKGEPIEIRIRRAGGSNQAYSKKMEFKVKPYKRQIQNETVDNEVVKQLLREAYAESIVLGWENVEDENGEELAFSVDNCVKLFTDLPDLFTDIQEQANKSALFRAEVRDNDAKN